MAFVPMLGNSVDVDLRLNIFPERMDHNRDGEPYVYFWYHDCNLQVCRGWRYLRSFTREQEIEICRILNYKRK